MTDALYAAMSMPDSCQLGKRVFKKLFIENGSLTAADKRAFTDDIDTIVWEYTLKPSTMPVKGYEDDDREYHEVAIIQVNLKTDKRTRRICEVVHRTIPYPIFLVLVLPPRIAISVAQKRFSRAEHGAIVAEDIRLTPWMDADEPDPIHGQFIESLALPGLPQTDFFALYTGLVDRVAALEAARLTGEYRLGNSPQQAKERRDRLADCRGIEQEIADLRAALKKETHFNRQVELNTRIKSLEATLKSHAQTL
ncbi:MAG: DUF4391 domain-containing protein [Phycisphaerales bacterium JB040]